jgi:PPE-repeat protein
VLDFGLVPPEINSARIYSGPGSASFIAASAAWTGLAADFAAAAAGHRSVIEALTSGPWLGPASAQVASAVAPFITWLSNSAEHAGQTASQATAAATAYEAARAGSVPPPAIAANRALVQELAATNVFGQNSGAIAQLEAQYAEFWAQDSGAMYTYAGRAAATTQTTELAPPAAVANPLGLIDQQIANLRANVGVLSQPLNQIGADQSSPIGGLLNSLSGPINGNGAAIDKWIAANTPLDELVTLYSKYDVPYVSTLALLTQGTQTVGQNTSGWSGIGNLANTLFKPAASAAQGAAGAAGSAAAGAGHAAAGAAGNLGAGLGGVAGGLGKAASMGGLSVPPSWAPWHATVNPGVASAIPAAAEGGPGGYPMGAPLGQFINGGGYGRNQPTYGFKPSVMAKPPAAG